MSSEATQIVDRFASREQQSGDLARIMELISKGGEAHLLSKLLLSTDELVVANGAYILSEIGETGRGLLPIALNLLRHPRQDVRYWAMNSVMCCADRSTAAKAIADAGLLSDPWELTRHAAARFLERRNSGEYEPG